VVFYFLSKTLNKSKWEQARIDLLTENPLVSIIVPGKNEGKHLYKLTRSLAEQSYRHYELIVVDDGSDDQTRIIGRGLERQGLIDLFISNEVRGGKASGANIALNYARGKYVVHFDADCSFDFDAVDRSLIPFYYDSRIAAVGGNLEVRNHRDSLATSLQAIEYLKVILVGRMVTSYLGIYRIISGAFGTFRTDVIKRIGGWDIGPGLDGDITVKLRKLGYRVHFEPSANGLTSVPDTFRKLTKQRLRWDKSIIRFRMRKHLDIFFPHANFSFINMFSSLENVGYNVLLNIKWIIYIIDMYWNYSHLLIFIIPANIALYTVANYLQFASIMLMVKNPCEKHRLLLYLPAMVFYTGYYLRVVRTIAHYKEIFLKESYDDPWNPLKSSMKAKALGL
jgi:cellulose synthase/poly-beta-1,6-N-acetylglucosamine synthase-like glycosyltransferase